MSRRASARYWYAMARAMGHTRPYSMRLAAFAWWTRLETITFAEYDPGVAGLLPVGAEYIASQREASLMQ